MDNIEHTVDYLMENNSKENLASKLYLSYKRIEALEREVDDFRKDLYFMVKGEDY